MKPKVFNPEPTKNEKPTLFELKQEDDKVVLDIVDNTGLSVWSVLEILPSGKIKLCSCIGEDTGLERNEVGEAIIIDEDGTVLD